MRRLVTRSLPVLASALLAAGCGSGNNGGSSTEGGNGAAGSTGTTSTSTQTRSQTTPAPAGRSGSKAIQVGMKEFAFVPSNAAAAAGTVAITARNTGSVPHELVLLKADRPPGSLPTDGSRARVDGPGAKVLGKTGHVRPGASKRLAVKLRPGAYVMICNLPGHYRSGMYGSLTVK